MGDLVDYQKEGKWSTVCPIDGSQSMGAQAFRIQPASQLYSSAR